MKNIDSGILFCLLICWKIHRKMFASLRCVETVWSNTRLYPICALKLAYMNMMCIWASNILKHSLNLKVLCLKHFQTSFTGKLRKICLKKHQSQYCSTTCDSVALKYHPKIHSFCCDDIWQRKTKKYKILGEFYSIRCIWYKEFIISICIFLVLNGCGREQYS